MRPEVGAVVGWLEAKASGRRSRSGARRTVGDVAKVRVLEVRASTAKVELLAVSGVRPVGSRVEVPLEDLFDREELLRRVVLFFGPANASTR